MTESAVADLPLADDRVRQLETYVRELLGRTEPLDMATPLGEQVELDSVTLIELAVILEEDMDIVVSDVIALGALSIAELATLPAGG
jgi:acyl carrier protein